MSRILALVSIAALLAGCATAPAPQKQSLPLTPPQDVAASPIVRAPLAQTPLPAPTPDTEKIGAAPLVPVVVPPDTLYVCVTDVQGVRQQTAIEFSRKVGVLCRKHPEMSACKYERSICRSHGGRVFAANGVEITQLTEIVLREQRTTPTVAARITGLMNATNCALKIGQQIVVDDWHDVPGNLADIARTCLLATLKTPAGEAKDVVELLKKVASLLPR